MQIYMQSDNGPIEVYLCPEEESANAASDPNAIASMSAAQFGSYGLNSEDSSTDTESESSPVKRMPAVYAPSPPPRVKLVDGEEEGGAGGGAGGGGTSSDLGQQIRNVLISASDDLGPMGSRLQLQTQDQETGECLFNVIICDNKCKWSVCASCRRRRKPFWVPVLLLVMQWKACSVSQ